MRPDARPRLALLALALGCAAEPEPMHDAVPTEPAALQTWLAEGHYTAWHAQSGFDLSASGLASEARSFLDDALFESVSAGAIEHPLGSAAVKELRDAEGNAAGWAVSVRTEARPGGGGWYWFHGDADVVRQQGVDVPECLTCHGAPGYPWVLTEVPLR